jgi:hypothetical protein
MSASIIFGWVDIIFLFDAEECNAAGPEADCSAPWDVPASSLSDSHRFHSVLNNNVSSLDGIPFGLEGTTWQQLKSTSLPCQLLVLRIFAM